MIYLSDASCCQHSDSDSASGAVGSSSTSAGFNLLYHGSGYLVTTNAAVASSLAVSIVVVCSRYTTNHSNR